MWDIAGTKFPFHSGLSPRWRTLPARGVPPVYVSKLKYLLLLQPTSTPKVLARTVADESLFPFWRCAIWTLVTSLSPDIEASPPPASIGHPQRIRSFSYPERSLLGSQRHRLTVNREPSDACPTLDETLHPICAEVQLFSFPASAVNSALYCGTPFACANLLHWKHTCVMFLPRLALAGGSPRTSATRSACQARLGPCFNPGTAPQRGNLIIFFSFPPLIGWVNRARAHARMEMLQRWSRWIALGCFSQQEKTAALPKVGQFRITERRCVKSIFKKRKKTTLQISCYTQISWAPWRTHRFRIRDPLSDLKCKNLHFSFPEVEQI